MNRRDSVTPTRPTNPIHSASYLSKHSFLWLRTLFKVGLQRPIGKEDIYECMPQHCSQNLSAAFDKHWSNEKCRQKPSLLRVLHRIYTEKFFLFGFVIMFLDTATKVAQPHCLGGLVTYFSPGNHSLTIDDAYFYAGGLIACSFVSVVTMHTLIFAMLQLGMCIRQTCCAMIYKKLLRLTKSVAVDGLNGQVINLMSNDVARFDQVLLFIHTLWKGPVELLLMAYYIYREIQLYGLIGVVLLLCFLPIQSGLAQLGTKLSGILFYSCIMILAWIGRLAATYRLRTAKRTDCRVRIMNEIIQAIQVIKMYTWEKPFAQMVDEIRRKELQGVRGTLFIRGTLLSFNIISRVSIFVSLASYAYFGNIFTARKVFIVTSYFNFLYFSLLHYWPLGVSSVSEARISINRIQEFLLMPENKAAVIAARDARNVKTDISSSTIRGEIALDNVRLLESNAKNDKQTTFCHSGNGDKSVIILKNVTAGWLDEKAEITTGIVNTTVTIDPGQLCAVIGTVGSGKSTLLQVILGELELDSGTLLVNGTVSYAAQEPWLFEGSVRQNIVFGDIYDEERYQKVIEVCSLQRDLQLLPHGDRTIVGERGASLSGGQRARVNLARAVYKRADIYLLDDPLSAVDTQVGKHIFEKCVRTFLHDRICVLVTHQLQYLKDVEHLVLMNSGHIVGQDTFQQLKNSKLHTLLWSGIDDEDDNDSEKNGNEIKRRSTLPVVLPSNAENTSHITTTNTGEKKSSVAAILETQIHGSVGIRVLVSYFAAVNNRFFVCVVLTLFVVAQTCISSVDWLVSRWVAWEQNHMLSSASATFESNYAQHHNNATAMLLVPQQPQHHQQDSQSSSDIATALVATRMQYIYTYAAVVLLVLYLVFQRSFAFFQLCLLASRHMHDRLFRGITRGWMSFFNGNPSGRILNRFSTDIGSVDTILPVALMDVLTFICELIAVFVLVAIANVWLLLPTFAMAAVCYGLRYIYINTARCVKRVDSLTRSPIFSHTNATLQGLATIRTFQAERMLTGEFEAHQDLNTSSWYMYLATSRAFSMWLELVCCAYMAAVLLCFLLFADKTTGSMLGLALTQIFNMFTMCQWGMRQTAEVENQMTSVERINEYTDLPSEPALETDADKQPPVEWPSYGAITFDALSMRYTADGAPVLRDLHFHIAAGEKIGIVGRTGAGKSSMIQALFRLAHNDGHIRIDGIDIGTLGLHTLRSRISIIPQDPILFSGTMRNNLDPFAERSDADIWSVLEQVQLKALFAGQPDGLSCHMSDGGSNLSMGQRQLVCLARAILRRNRVLILDEATANVDAETDGLIQTTIRKQFAECTVLTIAHRLHTVMDSDRVLVMDAGRLVELGHPHELLAQRDGVFRGLVEQTGKATTKYLEQLAEENFARRQTQQSQDE